LALKKLDLEKNSVVWLQPGRSSGFSESLWLQVKKRTTLNPFRGNTAQTENAAAEKTDGVKCPTHPNYIHLC
jgi:hypothetical protein